MKRFIAVVAGQAALAVPAGALAAQLHCGDRIYNKKRRGWIR